MIYIATDTPPKKKSFGEKVGNLLNKTKPAATVVGRTIGKVGTGLAKGAVSVVNHTVKTAGQIGSKLNSGGMRKEYGQVLNTVSRFVPTARQNTQSQLKSVRAQTREINDQSRLIQAQERLKKLQGRNKQPQQQGFGSMNDFSPLGGNPFEGMNFGSPQRIVDKKKKKGVQPQGVDIPPGLF